MLINHKMHPRYTISYRCFRKILLCMYREDICLRTMLGANHRDKRPFVRQAMSLVAREGGGGGTPL